MTSHTLGLALIIVPSLALYVLGWVGAVKKGKKVFHKRLFTEFEMVIFTWLILFIAGICLL